MYTPTLHLAHEFKWAGNKAMGALCEGCEGMLMNIKGVHKTHFANLCPQLLV